eukprot:scaffold2618_cov240-Pinguiococcus_pyrenoidosus.AAC.1
MMYLATWKSTSGSRLVNGSDKRSSASLTTPSVTTTASITTSFASFSSSFSALLRTVIGRPAAARAASPPSAKPRRVSSLRRW